MEELHNELVNLLRNKQFFDTFWTAIDRFNKLREIYAVSEKFFVSDPNFLYDLLSFMNLMHNRDREKAITLINDQDWEFITIARNPVDTAISLMKQYIKDRSSVGENIEIDKGLILLVRDKSQLFRFVKYFKSLVNKEVEIVEQKFLINEPARFLTYISSKFNVACPDVPKIDLKNPNPGLKLAADVEKKLREIFQDLLKDEIQAYSEFSKNFMYKIND